MLRRYLQSIMLCFTAINSMEARYCGQPDVGNARNSYDSNHDVHPANPHQPYPHSPPMTPIPPSPPPHLSPHADTDRRHNRCCPYDFDSRICKTINDRVLCGYDRNVGRPQSHDHAINLSQGCRIRGGRLECGYVHGPYTNPRRPPGNDQDSNGYKSDIESIDDGYLSDSNNNNNVPSAESPDMEKESLLYKETHHVNTTPKVHYPVTRCMEIHDRIVCRGVV